MAKNKQNPRDDFSNFFETAKSPTLKAHADLKVRILRDADKTRDELYLAQRRSWLGITFIYLKELGGSSAAVGFSASLAAGVFIGFYSPDWSELIASVVGLDALNEVDLIGSFFGMM